MNTFLFAWNPKKWDWKNLEQNIEELEKTGRVTQMWSCASHKSIKVGDRAFLIKLGKGKRGIIGAGFVATSPFLSPHWSGSGKIVPRVIVDFEALLNPTEDSILSIDLLKQGNLNSQHWSTQASGISIKSEVTEELESLWFDFLTTQKIRFNPFGNYDVENQKTYTEGTPNQVRLTKYERNPYARKKCIEHFGLSCQVCEVNFEKAYGEIGKDFIHVHHINQISDIGKAYQINPQKDLIPVCPNCHSMIHKRKIPYSIKEIKEIYLKKQFTMKYSILAILILLASCTKKNESEKVVKAVKAETPIKMTDKSVKFLWREDEYDKELKDTVNTIFINQEYCKNISEPEKAALGFVASFIGSECDWDGKANENYDNLSCKINTALNLGYQCSEKHLSFLRKWFKNDKKSLEHLKDCSAVPYTASAQNTFDYINILTKGDTIKITFKTSGVNMRSGNSWSYKEEDTFVFKKDNVLLVNSKESENEKN